MAEAENEHGYWTAQARELWALYVEHGNTMVFSAWRHALMMKRKTA